MKILKSLKISIPESSEIREPIFYSETLPLEYSHTIRYLLSKKALFNSKTKKGELKTIGNRKNLAVWEGIKTIKGK